MSAPIPVSDEAAARRIEIRDAWDRYDGQHPDSLDVRGGVNDNVALNDLATIIDTSVDFLWGAGSGDIEFSVMRGELEDVDATELLRSVWHANHQRTLLRKLGVSGSIAGHFALKLVPRDGELPRIVLLDPLDLVLQSDPRDIDRRIGYAIDTDIVDEFGSIIGRRREQHTLDEGGQSWTVRWLVTDTPASMHGVAVHWRNDPTREEPQLSWPYPWPAICDGQNLPNPHREWGRADISRDILHINEQINRTASNEAKTLRHFAHPQPVATSENPASMQSFIDAAIGSVLCLPTGATYAYAQLQSDGLAASALYREQLTDKLFEIARTPRIAAGRVDNIGSLSGVALLILYRPLIAKTETKRATYGDALRTLSLRILELAGVDTSDAEIVLAWPEVLPKNLKEEAETGLLLRELDVSLRTVLERIGIDYDRERQRVQEEAADPMGDAHGLLTRVEELAQRLADPALPDDAGGA